MHTGDCWAAAESGRCRPMTRQQALEALQQQVPASTADRTRPSVSSTSSCRSWAYRSAGRRRRWCRPSWSRR
ncbi:DUF6233 domain-containing protein [Streptomyces sp. NPDC088810]|uniref:DUF6233 domain-containing protein n=1 Tax=unclassified Streptomyces TaxID=2593676 RepID=UPI00382BFCBB